jgi:hypothetical protein
MNMKQVYNVVRSQAARYRASFPGMDNASINTAFHTDVRLLLTSKERYKNELADLLTLSSTLAYRLEGIAIGTRYKDLLKLEYPDCNSFDVEGWTFPRYESKQKEAKEQLLRYKKFRSLIKDANIFSAASEDQGYTYPKPWEYLAIALVESQKTQAEIEGAISLLKLSESLYFALGNHHN